MRAIRVSKTEQDRCIFGSTPAEYKKFLGGRGTGLADLVKRHVSELVKKEAVLSQVHVLFHWNDHSFFTYHQDEKGQVAVKVNLSPCTTTDFHVAGFADSAVMNGCGQAHVFPTKVFHRSGSAPRRCIKLVFFVDTNGPVVVNDDDGGTSSSAAKGEDDVVKEAAEVKQEVKQDAADDPFKGQVSSA